eukprot:CAMPEP_0175104982 /NCGR_PEP_ID=MMETSP0086_2-20121207/10111_1 /TAXON_ID=136419 /ORGANISM="Unknown Unknown, Strain D1" /LENGTH=37 /DNA_ID= /DNA_START= /DNA_END= /DNA_ORIENTATION=
MCMAASTWSSRTSHSPRHVVSAVCVVVKAVVVHVLPL